MSISATRRDHRSFCQYDVVYPIEHRTNLANAGTVHDGRLCTRMKWCGRQLLFRSLPEFPLRCLSLASVYAGLGFPVAPVHKTAGKQEQRKSASCPLPQSVPTGGDYGGIGASGSRKICFPGLFEDLACVNPDASKSLLVIRFQEVVNSVRAGKPRMASAPSASGVAEIYPPGRR